MGNYIIVGCDLSDRSMMLQLAHNGEKPQKKAFRNEEEGRFKMIDHLHARAKEAVGKRWGPKYVAWLRGLTGRDGRSEAVFEPTSGRGIPRTCTQQQRDRRAERLQGPHHTDPRTHAGGGRKWRRLKWLFAQTT